MNKTYPQPILIRAVAWIYIILATPAGLLFLGPLQPNRPNWPALAGPLLFLGLFYGGAWWLLWVFRGHYLLTDDAIILRQWGRQTRLRYRDICAIQEKDSQLLPYLVLITPQTRLTISGKVEGFSELYATLRQRVPALRAAKPAQLPVELRLNSNFWASAGLGFGVYAIFTGALSIGGVWGQPYLTLWHGLSLWGLFLTIAVAGFLLSEAGPPYAVTFTATRIEARYWLGQTRAWPAAELTRIERERQERRGRHGARMEVYPLVLTFAGGECLQLDEARIWSFGYSPDRLQSVLTQHFLSGSPGHVAKKKIAF